MGSMACNIILRATLCCLTWNQSIIISVLTKTLLTKLRAVITGALNYIITDALSFMCMASNSMSNINSEYYSAIQV